MTIKSCATCGGLYATAPGELFAGTPCRCVFPSSNEPLGMTTETDALPESVRRFDCTNGGAQWCQGCYTMTECNDGDYVRSEDYDRLIARVQELERENGDLRSVAGQHDTLGQRYARKCEAELAALKARIADAPLEVVESLPGAVGPPWPGDHWIEVRMAAPCACAGDGLIGKRVRLLVEE